MRGGAQARKYNILIFHKLFFFGGFGKPFAE
jgi:hypothetical protein